MLGCDHNGAEHYRQAKAMGLVPRCAGAEAMAFVPRCLRATSQSGAKQSAHSAKDPSAGMPSRASPITRAQLDLLSEAVGRIDIVTGCAKAYPRATTP